MYQRVKRVIDFVMALMGVIILSPLFLVLIIVIKLGSKGPILFKQKRVGIHKTYFNILKFRTMYIDTPKDMPTHLLQDPEKYITKVGKFLRKSSLDELPQILNILMGDMSVVGPRPALWNQYDLIEERDKYGANDIMPGLTGWAQINGRDELEILVKARLDGDYVDKCSFSFDLRCIFGTVFSVLRQEGVAEGGIGNSIALKKSVVLIGNHSVAIYNFRKELVQCLLENHYQVTVMLPYGDNVDKLIAMGCNYIDSPVDRRGTNLITDGKLLKHYYKNIKKLNPDVVLTYTIKPNIYGGMACQMLHIPYLANITGLGSALERGGIKTKIVAQLYGMGLHKAKKVFLQNEHNADFAIKHGMVHEEQVKLVSGSGVNLEDFKVLPYPSNASTTFLYIGRLMTEKGVLHFLEAAEQIKTKDPLTRFVLIGFCEDDYHEVVEKYVNSGIVEYPGMQRDVHSFIENADAIVLPSYHEGMANVLLEAAASGRPVIATNIGGCIETFEDGVTGIAFKPHDTEELYQALCRFLELSKKRREEMGLKGRHKMEQEFDRQIVVNKYMEEITSILTDEEDKDEYI